MCRPGVFHGPPPQRPLGVFLPPCSEEAHLPLPLPPQRPHKEGSGRGGASYRCSACQRLARTPGREAHTWTLCPSGVKTLLMELACLQRLGFAGILTPKVLGTPLCSLHNPSLPTGRRTGSYPCFIPAQRMQADEAISKEQGLSVASHPSVTSFAKMLALPRCS